MKHSVYVDYHSVNHTFTPGEDTLITTNQLLETSPTMYRLHTHEHIKMNDSKTEFIVLGTMSQLDKSPLVLKCIDKTEIQKLSCIKFLGAHLDVILSFKSHVKSKVSTANHILHLTIYISKFITREVVQMITCTLIFPHLDYTNSILVNPPKTTLKLLQEVQNSATRLVFQKTKFHHAQILLKEIHWLSIHQRCIYKHLTIVWKTLHGEDPEYLYEKLKVKTFTNTTRLANSVSITLQTPFNRHKTFWDNSFNYTSVYDWNSLPSFVKSAEI